jgi:DNA adenine methylase
MIKNNTVVLKETRNFSKPFLRWAGSKKKLIPKLIDYWSDDYGRYFEPFVGSGQLFFSINPEKSILSDTNKELIQTYQNIKTHPEKVYEEISKFEPTKENYYSLRAKNIDELNEIEISSRFICLNRYCFNGLYRTNSKGGFNVPFGNGNTGKLPSLANFLSISKTLKNATLLNEDFETVIRTNVRKGDFVYLDPPYAISNSKIFIQYGPHSFGLQDLHRMARLLDLIDEKGAYFLLSYASCKEATDYFGKWKLKKVETQRNIAGFAKHRRKEEELLFTNIKN